MALTECSDQADPDDECDQGGACAGEPAGRGDTRSPSLYGTVSFDRSSYRPDLLLSRQVRSLVIRDKWTIMHSIDPPCSAKT